MSPTHRFDPFAGMSLPERPSSPPEFRAEAEEPSDLRCWDCQRRIARGRYCEECRDDAVGPVVEPQS